MRHYFLLVSFLAIKMAGTGQNFHAINGSSFAGILGVHNNPASIVNTPFPWDINVLSLQVKSVTNAMTIHKYSLLSSPAKAEYSLENGRGSRYIHNNFNVNLLNARVAINRQSAVAAGINIRSYSRVKTGTYNYIDTLHGVEDFFVLNQNTGSLEADLISSSWLEIFGTYSRTIFDNERSRLNAGVTLKVSKGLAGVNTAVNNVSITPVLSGGKISLLTTGNARYAYSSNLDRWKKEKTTVENINQVVANAEGGVSFDAGFEYLIKPGGSISFGDEPDYFDYDWKIGVSLLDVGFNQYKYSTNSRVVSGIRDNMTGEYLSQKFNGINKPEAFNDSLAGVVKNMQRISGKFTVFNPARLVINVDRYLMDAFYINTDLSLNLSPLAGNQRFYTKEVNFLTVTPRWEVRKWGFFLPVQVNTEKRFWVGAAFKAGPVLFGIHNLGNVFTKNQMQNGGGYLSFVIRPGEKRETIRDEKKRRAKVLECP